MNTIVWLREDLRLLDNPALFYAAQSGEVTPVYIFPETLGRASYWWLHHSLLSMKTALAEHGVNLVLRSGDPSQVLTGIVKDLGAEQVMWNRVYSPLGIDQGVRLKKQLSHHGIKNQSYNAQLLIEPSKILNKQGGIFKVFTPFWKHCLANLNPSPPLPCPEFVKSSHSIFSESLESWQLLPSEPNWAAGFSQMWCAGEPAAQLKWSQFLESKMSNYECGRDIPSEQSTSLLSPYLTFGEISVKQLWFETHAAMAAQEIDSTDAYKYLSELGWREYSRYLLMHFPHIKDTPYNDQFDQFPWHDSPALLSAWQRGKTGYPIIDAGMRELWQTGYMHNRVRMIVASFLTKHCLIHWRLGAQWFWDTLLDADIANNSASWQWVAGCGADASPYFRIFNPILQGEKFDKEGDYVRKWVPELANLDSRFIHKPWQADPLSLQGAGVKLGIDYPMPIVDHKLAREAALDAYQSIKRQ